MEDGRFGTIGMYVPKHVVEEKELDVEIAAILNQNTREWIVLAQLQKQKLAVQIYARVGFNWLNFKPGFEFADFVAWITQPQRPSTKARISQEDEPIRL